MRTRAHCGSKRHAKLTSPTSDSNTTARKRNGTVEVEGEPPAKSRSLVGSPLQDGEAQATNQAQTGDNPLGNHDSSAENTVAVQPRVVNRGRREGTSIGTHNGRRLIRRESGRSDDRSGTQNERTNYALGRSHRGNASRGSGSDLSSDGSDVVFLGILPRGRIRSGVRYHLRPINTTARNTTARRISSDDDHSDDSGPLVVGDRRLARRRSSRSRLLRRRIVESDDNDDDRRTEQLPPEESEHSDGEEVDNGRFANQPFQAEENGASTDGGEDGVNAGDSGDGLSTQGGEDSNGGNSETSPRSAARQRNVSFQSSPDRNGDELGAQINALDANETAVLTRGTAHTDSDEDDMTTVVTTVTNGLRSPSQHISRGRVRFQRVSLHGHSITSPNLRAQRDLGELSHLPRSSSFGREGERERHAPDTRGQSSGMRSAASVTPGSISPSPNPPILRASSPFPDRNFFFPDGRLNRRAFPNLLSEEPEDTHRGRPLGVIDIPRRSPWSPTRFPRYSPTSSHNRLLQSPLHRQHGSLSPLSPLRSYLRTPPSHRSAASPHNSSRSPNLQPRSRSNSPSRSPPLYRPLYRPLFVSFSPPPYSPPSSPRPLSDRGYQSSLRGSSIFHTFRATGDEMGEPSRRDETLHDTVVEQHDTVVEQQLRLMSPRTRREVERVMEGSPGWRVESSCNWHNPIPLHRGEGTSRDPRTLRGEAEGEGNENSDSSDGELHALAQRVSTIRQRQIDGDYRLAMRISLAAFSDVEDDDADSENAAGPSTSRGHRYRPGVRRLWSKKLRSQRPVASGQTCIVCTDTPSEPVGCVTCRQLLGCHACIVKWQSTDNISELNRHSPLSMGISSDNHARCPLCRAKWVFGPGIGLWDDLRKDKDDEE